MDEEAAEALRCSLNALHDRREQERAIRKEAQARNAAMRQITQHLFLFMTNPKPKRGFRFFGR